MELIGVEHQKALQQLMITLQFGLASLLSKLCSTSGGILQIIALHSASVLHTALVTYVGYWRGCGFMFKRQETSCKVFWVTCTLWHSVSQFHNIELYDRATLNNDCLAYVDLIALWYLIALSWFCVQLLWPGWLNCLKLEDCHRL